MAAVDAQWFPAGVRRVRLTWRTLGQTAVAAMVALWFAADVLDHQQAFFAPIAAVVVIGVTQGQRLRRAAELVVGVSVGVLLGDLLIGRIGTGTWQMGLTLLLSMTVTVLIGAGPVAVMQSASSAVLIATLLPPTADAPVNTTRFVDALVGGLVALASAAVLLPVNPVRLARRATAPLLAELGAVLHDVAAALAGDDLDHAGAALRRARATTGLAETLHTDLDASREVARIAPVRWRARGQLLGYVEAEPHLDNVARNTRVLARQAQASLRRGELRSPDLPEVVRRAGDTVLAVGAALASDDDADRRVARDLAVDLAHAASHALAHTSGLAGQVVGAQARAIAVDLLLATGVAETDMLRMLPELPGRLR